MIVGVGNTIGAIATFAGSGVLVGIFTDKDVGVGGLVGVGELGVGSDFADEDTLVSFEGAGAAPHAIARTNAAAMRIPGKILVGRISITTILPRICPDFSA